MKSLVNHLRVAALPMSLVWADKETNISRAERALTQLPPELILLCFPNCFPQVMPTILNLLPIWLSVIQARLSIS